MEPGGRGSLRDNAFLVAAVALPVVVIAFFLLATAVPRWLVAPPAYDLLIRATDSYQPNSRVTVDFDVRGGTVVATVRAVAANSYGQRSKLFLFDHTTLSSREIAVELPDNLAEGDPPRVIAVDAVVGRQVLAGAAAPDGYQFESSVERGSGIVGDLFGMNRYGSQATLVRRGRVIPIRLPAPFQNVYGSPVNAVGWLVDDRQR